MWTWVRERRAGRASARAGARIVNNLVEVIVPLSPGLASSPTEPMTIDAAHVLLGYSGVYMQYYGVRIPYTCGSNVWNNLGHSATASSLHRHLDNEASGLRHGSTGNVAQVSGSHQGKTQTDTSLSYASVTRTTSKASHFSNKQLVPRADLAPCDLCALSPVEIENLAGLDVVAIALGRTFGMAVASETYSDASTVENEAAE